MSICAELHDWLTANEQLIQQVGNISLLMLAVTIVVLPQAVAKLPADYFVTAKRSPSWRARKYPLLWGGVTVIKNLLGIILILAGLAMLVLPGQGTLTILVGLVISDFPGKYSLERRFAGRPAIGTTLNKIRALMGAPPLVMPAAPGKSPKTG